MSNRFHNKFHRANHHSQRTFKNTAVVDASYDPIASYLEPFQGEFYSNNEIVTDTYLSASDVVYGKNIVAHESLSAQQNVYATNGIIENNLTIKGDLFVLGDASELHTFVNISSAISVTNTGTGPALSVIQTGDNIIANFVDDTNSALFIDGRLFAPGYIGINTTTPNERLTVVGNISSNGVIFSNNGSSNNWQSNYGTVSSLSANWESNYETVNSLSANWQSNYGTVSSLSANWESNYETVNSLSANWQSNYGTVSSLSANWQSNYGTVNSLSANWESVYTTVLANSATKWDNEVVKNYVHTNFIPISGGTITGSLSVLGDVTYIDTSVAVASAVYIDTTSGETALRITQKGPGDAIRVEDETNPDSTPFIVNTDGLVGIGTAIPNEKLTVVGNVSATNTVYANTVNLSSITFTGETTTSTTSVTATDTYIKIIVNGQPKYLRMFDVI